MCVSTTGPGRLRITDHVQPPSFTSPFLTQHAFLHSLKPTPPPFQISTQGIVGRTHTRRDIAASASFDGRMPNFISAHEKLPISCGLNPFMAFSD